MMSKRTARAAMTSAALKLPGAYFALTPPSQRIIAHSLSSIRTRCNCGNLHGTNDSPQNLGNDNKRAIGPYR